MVGELGKKEDQEMQSADSRQQKRIIRIADCGFPVFHSTFDMIRALERGEFPARAMLTLPVCRKAEMGGSDLAVGEGVGVAECEGKF